jgi:DNA-binding NarL/FixJ family response regulator
MKPVICFIDDSEFEHTLVRQEIAACAPDLEFVLAYTFEEAREELRLRRPGLFLLDLWGKDQSVPCPYVTTRDELERKIAAFPSLHDVFSGLEDAGGDITNEYLKRLFGIVDGWRSLFEEVCERIGQNRKYGLSNLDMVRRYYPRVPAVFYTRKSLIHDAVAMFTAGADGLFIKPTGSNDEETRRLTRQYAPTLVSDLRKMMTS